MNHLTKLVPGAAYGIISLPSQPPSKLWCRGCCSSASQMTSSKIQIYCRIKVDFLESEQHSGEWNRGFELKNPTTFDLHKGPHVSHGHQDTSLLAHSSLSQFWKHLQAVTTVDETHCDTQTQREGDMRNHVSRLRESTCAFGRDVSWPMGLSCWLMPTLMDAYLQDKM